MKNQCCKVHACQGKPGKKARSNEAFRALIITNYNIASIINWNTLLHFVVKVFWSIT